MVNESPQPGRWGPEFDAAMADLFGPEYAPRATITCAAPPALWSLAEPLYRRTSALPLLPWGVHTPPLRGYLEALARAAGVPMPELGELVHERPLQAADPAGPWWVAYSGGKDSMAAAVLLREQGHDVELYHVAGINRSLPDETSYAVSSAFELGLPLRVEQVRVHGPRGPWVEIPTKNQVIATMMVGEGLAEGIAGYTLGVTTADEPSEMRVELNWSDGTEAVLAWHEVLAERVEGLQFRHMLRHETESIAVLAERGLLELAHGCMAPLRYREQLRKRNQDRYGDLMPGRCGSCTKCCSEQLVLHALGYDPREGLAAHAAAFMYGKLASETNHPEADPVRYYVRFDIVEEYRARERARYLAAQA